jgi:hypothetical protein
MALFEPDGSNRRCLFIGAKLTRLGLRHQDAGSPKQGGSINTRSENAMPTTPLDPYIADTAPSDPVLTVYDQQHLVTYLRLLDADAQGADWREVARVVLHLDPEH